MIYVFKDKIGKFEVAHLYLYTVKLPSRHLGVIEDVWTDEKYRLQGRATKLLERAIEKGKELKLDVIELTVRYDKPYVRDFYIKLGFYDRQNFSLRYPINDVWAYKK